MQTADLAIIIPSSGRWDRLLRTLGGLAPQAGDADVVVVLDGLDLRPPPLPVGRTLAVAPGGPGAARNRGVADTDRPLLLLLGDDMVPAHDLVDHHLAAHRAAGSGDASRTAVLGHVDWHPEVADDRLLRWMDWSATQFDYRSLGGAATDDAGASRFYSCNVSLSRALFDAVGGFDPDFAFYYEDLDMGLRLAAAGMRLRYEPRARVEHLHAYSWDDVVRRFEGIAVGEHTMTTKHPGFEPFYRGRVLEVARRPPVSSLWPRLADRIASSRGRAADLVRARANAWYHQQLGPRFLEAWYRDDELRDLREYLGEDFDERGLIDHVARVEAEERAAPDETTFYRTSRAYLYDLTVFAVSGTKAPYRRDLRRLVAPGARLLDYGCGIGSDGLRLLDEGYDVSFADHDSPSTDYLRWRLARRGLAAPVHDVEGRVTGGHDLVYCFDVLEHVADPMDLLARLEALASIVLVNLLEPVAGDTHVHHELDVEAVLDRAASRGLLHLRRYHQRSHLVAYRGASPSSAPERTRGRALRTVVGHLAHPDERSRLLRWSLPRRPIVPPPPPITDR